MVIYLNKWFTNSTCSDLLSNLKDHIQISKQQILQQDLRKYF